jgi:hypothetical protein
MILREKVSLPSTWVVLMGSLPFFWLEPWREKKKKVSTVPKTLRTKVPTVLFFKKKRRNLAELEGKAPGKEVWSEML